MDNFIVSVPIIGLLFAVRAFAAGAVEPEAEYIAVICAKLGELIYEVIVICVGAVSGLVSVPRGEVNAEFETVFLAALCKLSYDILAVGAVHDAVIGVFSVEKAEAVVMLRCEDNAL